jgi:hypothetical protein
MEEFFQTLAGFLRTLDYYVPRYMPYVLLPFVTAALVWELVKWKRHSGD